MIRVAFKGLAARRLRTALTALAIVLGVAMVSAAFTITDTMRGAADSLSSAAYDGTDAVVGARTAFRWTPATGRPSGRPSTPRLLEQVRAVPRRGRRRRRRHATRPRSSSATASRPATARTSASASTPSDAGRRAAHAVPPRQRPLGRRPGRGRASTPPPPRTRATRVGDTRARSRRAARAHDFRSSASRASARSSRSAPRRRPCSTCATAQELFGRGDQVDGDPRRRARRRRPPPSCARPSPRRCRRPQVATAAKQDRFTLDGPGAVHLDHPDRAARVRRRGDPRRRVHDLQHALDHRRPAHA